MKTILIHGDDPELTNAWASYLSQDGDAVFTSTDSLEAAEVMTMIKIDTLILSTNNPATYLIVGKVMKTRKRNVNIVAVTRIRRTVLELLLETPNFTAADAPFMFSELKSMVKDPFMKIGEMENAFV
jgi:DNA-binding response OmpR family regulator